MYSLSLVRRSLFLLPCVCYDNVYSSLNGYLKMPDVFNPSWICLVLSLERVYINRNVFLYLDLDSPYQNLDTDKLVSALCQGHVRGVPISDIFLG